MVDEIDLHLHPRWQMKVISTIARTFPRMQFIFTSHSPLVAGSLEWMNIITLKLGSRSNSTRAVRLHGEHPRPRCRPGAALGFLRAFDDASRREGRPN